MTKLLIGLTGSERSGKTTAAKHLFRLGGFVLDNVLLENEADRIRRRGGVVIHIQRAGCTSSEACIAINDNDLVIHNDGDLTDFLTQVDAVIDIVRKRVAARAAGA